ncbi:hypothetical protein O181_079922, partial [Austropuccinia psidii MF-1]|nr:hypothetical protein [Austropuccinia psidii MF-1]
RPGPPAGKPAAASASGARRLEQRVVYSWGEQEESGSWPPEQHNRTTSVHNGE